MAIGRYLNPYLNVEWHRPLPPGTSCEPLQLVTPDHAVAHGWLYARGGERTVACLMHPRANFSRHYAVPALLEAGVAVLCENSRWLNNDATLIHERVLLDVAEGLRAARERYERVVLIGNSGGGSLYTFYLSQASAPEGARLTETAAGEPLDLNRFDLPGADGMIYLAAHPGEGYFLLNAIDPSVVSEGDPLACDPQLDLYEPGNGFAPPPESSRYAPAFLASYRAAQRARIERIDSLALARVERKRRAREAGNLRGAMATDFLLVYRTDADPRAVDLSLDPSQRDYGSLWGRRPDLINYGPVGFARVVSPEAWLSTWSGIRSRAEISETGPHMTLPALVIDYAGDNAIYPSDTEHIVRSLGSQRVERRTIDGDHYGFPTERGRDAALDEMVAWLRETA